MLTDLSKQQKIHVYFLKGAFVLRTLHESILFFDSLVGANI